VHDCRIVADGGCGEDQVGDARAPVVSGGHEPLVNLGGADQDDLVNRQLRPPGQVITQLRVVRDRGR
jgi:hypothetical protein